MKQYKIIQKDRPILKSAGLPFPENNAYIQVGVESGWTIVCGKQDLNRFFSTEKEAKDFVLKQFSTREIEIEIKRLEKEAVTRLTLIEKETKDWLKRSIKRLRDIEGVIKP